MDLQAALSLARQSTTLDRRLMTRTDMPLRERAEFLVAKYRLLGRHARRPFALGEDAVTLRGQQIYYDTRFGLAAYQGILTRTQHLLDIGGVRTADVVVDVGANVGFFSMMANRRFAQPEIMAIEPGPLTFRCLERNLRPLPRATALNLAVSDRAGDLLLSVDPQNSAISTVSDHGNTRVMAKTMDDILDEHGVGRVDLLKIDTESFEAHVLRGARRTLERTRHVLMEVTVEGNERYTVPSLLSLLQGDAYSFQLVAMRNFSDRGEGAVPILDCLFTHTGGARRG